MLESRKNEKSLLKELAPVRRKAGRVRDMDVFTGFTAGLHHSREEQECQVELLEYLGAERYRHCRSLRRAVRRHRGSIRANLKRSLRLIKRGLGKADGKQPSPGSEWPIDAMAVALKLSTELGSWPALNAGSLHPYRLKTKQLLYVLQLADQADEELVASLSDVKDAIGEWHDWQELEEIAKKVVGHSHCGLLHQIHATTQAKLDHALATANAMLKVHRQERPHQRRGGRGKRVSANRPSASMAVAATSLAA